MGESLRSIHIQGLSAGYGVQTLCTSLNLEIFQGQGLGIIGANGSGKSTVLRTIFDLQAPLDGTVEYCGSRVQETSLRYRQDFALLLEDGTFFDELTVAEHLGLIARGHGISDPDRAVGQELEFFELQRLADALPHQLSSGQRRKLMLAACLIRPAHFLILDEPEQRLDPTFRERLARRLEARRVDGAGLVIASHDAQMLAGCTQRAVLLTDAGWQIIDTTEAMAWFGR